jgi:hypothetical protein
MKFMRLDRQFCQLLLAMASSAIVTGFLIVGLTNAVKIGHGI